ncbi:hypothetical protein ROZALSC1DRAFT_31679, partial [Rozella allomycis CSF55]
SPLSFLLSLSISTFSFPLSAFHSSFFLPLPFFHFPIDHLSSARHVFLSRFLSLSLHFRLLSTLTLYLCFHFLFLSPLFLSPSLSSLPTSLSLSLLSVLLSTSLRFLLLSPLCLSPSRSPLSTSLSLSHLSVLLSTSLLSTSLSLSLHSLSTIYFSLPFSSINYLPLPLSALLFLSSFLSLSLFLSPLSTSLRSLSCFLLSSYLWFKFPHRASASSSTSLSFLSLSTPPLLSPLSFLSLSTLPLFLLSSSRLLTESLCHLSSFTPPGLQLL